MGNGIHITEVEFIGNLVQFFQTQLSIIPWGGLKTQVWLNIKFDLFTTKKTVCNEDVSVLLGCQ